MLPGRVADSSASALSRELNVRSYLLRRVLELLPTTFGILLLTFVLFHVIGGSPADVVLGKSANAESLAAFDARYGYDRPLIAGNWARLRALPDGPPSRLRAVAAATGTVWRAPLAYALPAGTYRLLLKPGSHAATAGLAVGLRPEGDQEIHRTSVVLRPRGRSWTATFQVPEGWRAAVLEVDGPPPTRWSLRRRTRHGFDSQFGHYLGGLLRADLGVSTEQGRPVWQVLRDGVGPSLALTVPILVLGTLLALGLGLVAALWREERADRSVLLLSTVLMSVNYVVWVVAGQYLLAFRLRLFPIWGFENLAYVLLPVTVGVVSGLGRDIRFYRAVFLDELYRPYVRTAIAKGLSPAAVLVRHVLRNSLIPILTYVSLSVPFLFTGSVLLESFFGIPGLGSVSLNAIHSSDMAVVRAVVIIGALLYQAVNLLTDLGYAWLDPRIRLGSRRD